MYYAFIENNRINGTGECECLTEGVINAELTEEQYNLIEEKGSNYYIYQDGQIILNPDYEAEEEAKRKQELVKEYKEQLAVIDNKSLRATRAIIAGTGTDEDREFIANLEAQAEELREKIRELENLSD